MPLLTMTAPAAIRACFVDARQVKSRAVYQLTFEVGAEEANNAIQTLGGLPHSADERWVGIALLKDEKAAPAKPQRDSVAAKERYRAKDEGEQAVARAGMLAADPAFWRWTDSRNEADAAQVIRVNCGVQSRKDIAHSDEALARFKTLEMEYLMASGRAAEPR